MLNMVLLFIGTTEIIVIGAIALLIFGGKKLPELMRGLGKGVKEFREEVDNVKQEISGEKNGTALEKEIQSDSETTQEPKNE